MVISPRMSEKAYLLAQKGIYVFDVPLSANKAEVIRTISEEYPDVEISDVRLMITKGKTKAVNRGKRSRPGKTTRSNTKKAYITLSKGEIAAFKELMESEEQ